MRYVCVVISLFALFVEKFFAHFDCKAISFQQSFYKPFYFRQLISEEISESRKLTLVEISGRKVLLYRPGRNDSLQQPLPADSDNPEQFTMARASFGCNETGVENGRFSTSRALKARRSRCQRRRAMMVSSAVLMISIQRSGEVRSTVRPGVSAAPMCFLSSVADGMAGGPEG